MTVRISDRSLSMKLSSLVVVFILGLWFISTIIRVEANQAVGVANDVEFWIYVRVGCTLSVMFGVMLSARFLYVFVMSKFTKLMEGIDRRDQALMATNVAVQEMAIDLRKEVNTLSVKIQETSSKVNVVAEKVTPIVNKVNSGMDKACDMYETYSLITVIIACVAMSRNLYARWNKKDGENKEAKMSEKDVFIAFDTFAVMCFIPLFMKDGFGAAARVWGSIRSLGVMVRTLVDGVHLFSGWFGSQDSKTEDAFTGIGFIDTLGKTTDEMVDRVEKNHISKLKPIEFMSSGYQTVPPPENYSPPLPLNGEEKEIYPEDRKQCMHRFCLENGKDCNVPTAYPVKESVPSVRTDPEVMWSGLRKIWDKQEDSIRLVMLKKEVEKHPWILPLIMFILFAALLMLVRWMRKSEEKEGLFSVVQTKIPGIPSGCCHSQYHLNDGTGKHCPLGDKKPTINSDQCCSTYCGGKWCTHWAGCSGHTAPVKVDVSCLLEDFSPKEEKERKKSSKVVDKKEVHQKPKKKGSRKPWVDYDGVADEYTYIEDDTGSIYHRMSKKELAAAEEIDRYNFEHPMDKSANADVPLWGLVKGDISERKRKFLVKASQVGFRRVARFDVKEGADIVVVPTRLVKYTKCTGKSDCVCGRFHLKPKVEKQVKKELDKKDISSVRCSACGELGHYAGKYSGGTRGNDGKWSGGAWVKTCTATANPEMKEAAINGKRFPEMGGILECVGWAVCGLNELCFTLCLNGIVVSEHLFKGSDEVTFNHAKYEAFVCKKDKGKLIARDQMWFPIPNSWKNCKQLQCAKTVAGEKVKMYCFDSKEEALWSKGWSDQGVVKNVVDAENLERAACTYSSDFGNCSGPVINTNGKCVGWHNATTKVETAFIPVTAVVVAKATGSAPSF